MRFAKSHLLFVAFILVLAAGAKTAAASDIDSYNVTIDVSSEKVSFVQARVAYNSLTSEKLSFLFFSDVSNFKAADDNGLLDCTINRASFGTEMLCTPNTNRKNVTSQSPYLVAMSFDSRGIVAQNQGLFVFFVHFVSDPTSLLRVKVLLPDGTVLPKSDGVAPYYPDNAAIGSTGRRVILEWDMNRPRLGDKLNFTVQFESTNSSLVIILAALAVIALLGLAAFFYYRNRQSRETVVISVLKGDEKKAIDVIRQHGGSCRQRDIVKQTDFSKAKVSRILTLLEERGVVQKDRKGRTNKVFLSDGRQKEKKEAHEKKESHVSENHEKQEQKNPEEETKKPFGQ